MALYPMKNRSTEDPQNLIPDMPGYSAWRDKPFEGMRTEQDQIWWLYAHICELLYLEQKVEDLTARVEALEKWRETVDARLIENEGDIAKILAMLCALAQNALVYDVTRGVYAPSMPTARREFQETNVCGLTVEEAATVTVAELSMHTCREVACVGRVTVLGLGPDYGHIAEQRGYSCARFNPDEYVKKSDLTLIDTDNLAEHVIMGVLEKDAASDYVDPAPYLRPMLTEDLAGAFVRSDTVVVVPE